MAHIELDADRMSDDERKTAIGGKWMHMRTVFKRQLDQPQFQTGPIGVRVQQGPKLPPL